MTRVPCKVFIGGGSSSLVNGIGVDVGLVSDVVVVGSMESESSVVIVSTVEAGRLRGGGGACCSEASFCSLTSSSEDIVLVSVSILNLSKSKLDK